MRVFSTFVTLALCGLSSIKALPYEVVNGGSELAARDWEPSTPYIPNFNFDKSTYLARATANSLNHFCTNFVNSCGDLADDNQVWVASCNFTVMTTDQYSFYKKDCRGRTPKYHPSCGKWGVLGNNNCWKNPCDDDNNTNDNNNNGGANNNYGVNTSPWNTNNNFNQGLPNPPNQKRDELEERCDTCNNDDPNAWWQNAPSYVNYPTGQCSDDQHCSARGIGHIPKDQCEKVHYKHNFKFYLQATAFCYIQDSKKSDECAAKHKGIPYDFSQLSNN